MNFTKYIIPTLISLLFLYAIIKKKGVYNLFVDGANKAIPLAISLFPYVAAVILMSVLFEESGLSDVFINFLTPVLSLLGIPKELAKLIIIKPFSGSGSLALLDSIYKTYGANSYLAFLASTLYGSSETIFYISTIYYAKCKNKKAIKGILISLTACLISTVFCCFICKFFYK